MQTRPTLFSIALVFVAAFVSGCGGDKNVIGAIPSSPTATSAHATPNGSAVTALDTEVENGPEDNHGNGNEPGDDHGNEPGDNLDDHQGDDHHGEVELTGTVSGRAGTCPALSFMVSTTRVATTASTVFRDVTCAALANGNRVEVKGSRQANGSVTAARIEKK